MAVAVILLASGCTPSVPQAAAEQATLPSAVELVQPTATGTPFLLATSTPTATASLADDTPTAASTVPASTPTVVNRQPAEDWQNWPVIPEVTNTALNIYQSGLAMGTDPAHFSRVGDCQSIQEAFMGLFDTPSRFTLVAEHAYLQETIDNFKGSFERDGMAVHGGFTAASPLSPMLANPDYCQPGENPLECEFRIYKPSIVFIDMEVWWDGRTPETYTRYMRKLIDFAISKGAVPILATKADNVEGDYSINLATARLALEYDLPLWNFWRAVQKLDNHGIDRERGPFHISYDAWSTRSFTGLEALDAVWRGVSGKE